MPVPTTDKVANRLINEKSPYLLQHAYNPVDWYAWNEEAFAKAKAEDKPIFFLLGIPNIVYSNLVVIGVNYVTITKGRSCESRV
jgi:hypothetical protein